ncbi:MAG: alanine--tRNA ligase [Planctomycetales bacterium]|nr:alanine--tRNA ligase [Planctomycetales bacterium]
MQTDELREKYLSFFESKGHARRPSDVLVPTWDASVLFTPAGMNQFKDHFLGKVKLEFTRATTCQKCLRTGDIDNVGRTAYHHTFFEMLGNFSFGDYFKEDAIRWAWEFLTEKKWLGIPADRLTVTVYKDDNEAAAIWHEKIGLPSQRIQRMGEDDNFWPASAPSQGPDGVCGPCSEIFFHPDNGKEVEIWNLVFTQFNRVGDPPDNLKPLPSKNIDTGMGLERTAAVLQGVETNFHIDILRPIVNATADVCSVKYALDSDDGRRVRRITDHIRACTFAIHENVYPGAHKEKYVVKRLLRRAVLDGHQMGMREPFLYKIVPAVVQAMTSPYPELAETQERVAQAVQQEESNFFATIDGGLNRIDRIFQSMEAENKTTVDGGEAAELYQTYGVPPELFETMAAEQSLTFDWNGFHRAMEKHGQTSGKIADTVMGDSGPIDAIKKAVKRTEFLGYGATSAKGEVKALMAGNDLKEECAASADRTVAVVLDRTPFYAEAGGQVGDVGTITTATGTFEVTDTQKDGEVIFHWGRVTRGTIATGEPATADVNVARREGIQRAHSATHILHFALHKTLGSHAQQQGSKVDDDLLRFDFTNLKPVDAEELLAIERDANEKVQASEAISAKVIPLAEAREAGAMMLFGEKYPDPVRMISMGDFSRELCGGTHLQNTSQVGLLDIVSEEGVAAGTRRIVAYTGRRAEQNVQQTAQELQAAGSLLGVPEMAVPEGIRILTQNVRSLKKQAGGGEPGEHQPLPTAAATNSPSHQQRKTALREAARLLNVPPFEVSARVQAMLAEVESLKEEIAKLSAAGDLSADGLLERGVTVGATHVVTTNVPGANPNLLRQLIDQVRRKSGSCAVMLATSPADDKVTLVAGVSRDLIDQGIRAGDWVKEVAPIVGGGGGGKPDMAQAGGKVPAKIDEALKHAAAFLQQKLGA